MAKFKCKDLSKFKIVEEKKADGTSQFKVYKMIFGLFPKRIKHKFLSPVDDKLVDWYTYSEHSVEYNTYEAAVAGIQLYIDELTGCDYKGITVYPANNCTSFYSEIFSIGDFCFSKCYNNVGTIDEIKKHIDAYLNNKVVKKNSSYVKI